MGTVHKHLTKEDRCLLKQMLDEGKKKHEIARCLGVHISSLYREIERGSIDGKYDPLYSDHRYKTHLSNKGPESLLTPDSEFARYISKAILEENLSPAQISERLQTEPGFENCPKSVPTIYHAIYKGIIPGVTKDSLRSNVTTVFSDGQVHLAKWIRDELGIQDGDSLYVELLDGRLIMTKIDGV